MNLTLEVERVNDISFSGKRGIIDMDVPRYELNTILEEATDEELIEVLESRGYIIEKEDIN